ncbi:hypothetical protein B4U78_016250 [Microbacterium esteraromaticum]|nr:hypothetical protein B4U78_016250 [Microbacterium esteraromaticum]
MSRTEIQEDPELRNIVLNFCNQFHQDIYEFNLSLTQSRRVKAGKELENIVELIFKACDIPIKKQGIIKEKGVKKIIDLISPSPENYQINPEKVILISCKTTLRERWQEVLEEIRDIQGPQIFLVTLDKKFSDSLLSSLTKFNIQLVVLETVKRNYLTNK